MLLYGLDNNPVTYDFFVALCASVTATNEKHVIFSPFSEKIKFNPRKFPEDFRTAVEKKTGDHLETRRYKNILLSGCALAECSYTDGVLENFNETEVRKAIGYANVFRYPKILYGHDGRIYSSERQYLLPVLLDVYACFGQITKLSSPKKESFAKHLKKPFITITLRNSRSELRNSLKNEWESFAKIAEKDFDVMFIDDAEMSKSPLPHGAEDVQNRLAIYENAEMNFHVSGGPATLCWLSDAPYMIFKMAPEPNCTGGSASQNFMDKVGLWKGRQLPWATREQSLLWEKDTCDNILCYYKRWLNEKATDSKRAVC